MGVQTKLNRFQARHKQIKGSGRVGSKDNTAFGLNNRARFGSVKSASSNGSVEIVSVEPTLEHQG